MWVEADQPIHTFGEQTQRSFVNTLTGAAKRRISDAWHFAALAASASVGKLPRLDELLAPDEAAVVAERTKNAKLLSGLLSLKQKGIRMHVERVERLH